MGLVEQGISAGPLRAVARLRMLDSLEPRNARNGCDREAAGGQQGQRQAEGEPERACLPQRDWPRPRTAADDQDGEMEQAADQQQDTKNTNTTSPVTDT